MKLLLQRHHSEGNATIGEIIADGRHVCFTLEDVVRDEKIYGVTAIPAGTYEIIITPSARFKRDLPLLLNVPNFEGVRIHPGNVAADTHGCILPGQTVAPDCQSIGHSKAAFDKLNKMIQDALAKKQRVTIEILNG